MQLRSKIVIFVRALGKNMLGPDLAGRMAWHHTNREDCRVALLPSGSPFGDLGPHGDLFQFLGPQKVPIFFQGPHFLYFRLKNALKVRASTIILVICILKGEFSETHLFNENGTNLCTK